MSSSPQCLNSLALFQLKLDFHVPIAAGPHLGDCAMWATTVLRVDPQLVLHLLSWKFIRMVFYNVE